MYTLFVLFVLSTLTKSYGQEFTIEGKVSKNNQEALGFVNVLVLQQSDSTVIKGNSTLEDGSYQIANLSAGNYILKFSFVGYKKVFKEISIASDAKIELVVLEPLTENLEDITITAKKKYPQLKRKVDRLVFEVAQTSLTDTNIWELLKRTPGIIVVNNEISIKGSSNIQVLINNRKVSLPKEDILNLLTGTEAGSVSSIELITNPSAKYDAEGGAIVNINMNKNIARGYNGSVFTNYTVGVYPKYTLGTSHFFKSEKTQLAINYTVADRKRLSLQNEIVDFIENDEIASIWNTNLEGITDSRRHTVSAFFDYIPNAKHTFSASVITSVLPTFNLRYLTNTAISDPNGIPTSSFTTFNHITDDNLNLIFNLDYVRKLNDKGAQFVFNSGYTYYDYERLQELDTDFFLPDGTKTGDNDFSTDSDQRIHIFNAQGDFNFPLTKNDEVEAGVKYASIDALSTIEQPGFDPTQPGDDPTENDRFEYDESIVAAYLSYSRGWSNWNFKAGLRAEFTETKGISDMLGRVNDNEYLEIFPTFYLQYVPNSTHDFSINYGRRIKRPRYASINPFKYFTGNNIFVQGDPALNPAFKDLITLSYTLNETYTFEIYYRFEKNALKHLTFQNNDSNIIRYLNTNIDREVSYGFDFLTYKSITNFWDLSLVTSYFYGAERFRNVENGDNLVDNSLWTLYLTFDNYFTISAKDGLTGELGGEYVSEIILGNARQEDYSFINAAVSKTMLKNKARLTIGIKDIFNNGYIRTNRFFDNQSSTRIVRDENRLFTIAFRYRFGNTRLKNASETKTIEERERLN
ncbi:outer membrane beta-barrel protein [Ascidiimonas sp. W6]|uniref:outer membrane beta-barrel protein n=1 Tax=Ascidiimonas meishanensis TaxID=3128903 RepID=UPI0030ECE89F